MGFAEVDAVVEGAVEDAVADDEQEFDGALEGEIKALIIEALMLEDVTATEIDSEAPLFVEGLGLDSIDALEIAIALEERYGVQIEEDPEKNQELFGSVRSLASFVSQNRGA